MTEKVTKMVLKVDCQCKKCRKKVKKILCKLPEIQDQIYDEKQSTVTITAVSCCPEKLRDKICCKGGGSITSIEIKPPDKNDEPGNKPTPPTMVVVPVPVPAPGYPPYYPIGMCCPESYWGRGGGPWYCCGVLPWCYDVYYGRPVYDSLGGGAGCTIFDI